MADLLTIPIQAWPLLSQHGILTKKLSRTGCDFSSASIILVTTSCGIPALPVSTQARLLPLAPLPVAVPGGPPATTLLPLCHGGVQ